MPKRAKTSGLWEFFTITDHVRKQAKCDSCGHIFSYKTTISNLKTHLKRRHPFSKLTTTETKSSVSQRSNISPELVKVEENAPLILVASTSVSETIPEAANTSFYEQKFEIGEVQLEIINKQLLKIFITDLHPFSLVEDEGFIALVKALNPNYTLPSRKEIVETLFSSEYDLCEKAVYDLLMGVENVSLTCETWTSHTTETYISITAHFINDEFVLQSILLQCTLLPHFYVAQDLAGEILAIIQKFGLQNKVSLMTTNNAPNIKNAICTILRWEHFVCFAQAINLIVIDAINAVPGLMETLESVKTIIDHFCRSTAANEKLKAIQIQLGLSPKKLKQGVSTRWNATFYMLQRFISLEQAIKTTIALINKGLPILSEDEWKTCKDLCIVLEPFEQVTKQISDDKYVMGSIVMILSNGLAKLYSKLKAKSFTETANNLISELENGIKDRLGHIEQNKAMALATLLDPRFKDLAFSNKKLLDNVKEYCLTELSKIWESRNNLEMDSTVANTSSSSTSNHNLSIWDDFDCKVSSIKPTDERTKEINIEMERYLSQEYLDRSGDPLQWWKQHEFYFPNISTLVRKKFCVTASSVSCERLFSKAGDIINDRRSRLKALYVEKLLFLHENLFLLE